MSVQAIEKETRHMGLIKKIVGRVRQVRRGAVGSLLLGILSVALGGSALGGLMSPDVARGEAYAPALAEGSVFPGSSSFWAGTCALDNPDHSGSGTPPAVPLHCMDFGTVNPVESVAPLWTTPPAWRLDASTQAGAHPDGSLTFTLPRAPSITPFKPALVASLKDATAVLPAGFVGNPQAVPMCKPADFQVAPATCPPETQIGILTTAIVGPFSVAAGHQPVYNAEPRRGQTAEIAISPSGLTDLSIVADVRTDGDFGIDSTLHSTPTGLPLLSQTITLWGVPWDRSHDLYRPAAGSIGQFGIPTDGVPAANRVPYNAGWGPIRPFITNPTECTGDPVLTALDMNSWQSPDEHSLTDSEAPAVTGCDVPGFAPTATLRPTSSEADSATGLQAQIGLPQNNDAPAEEAFDPDHDTGAPAFWESLEGAATAHLKKTVVTLPEGLAVNPSAAAGLAGCTDEQIGFDPSDGTFSKDEPTCPDGSKIGTATVETPLLAEPVNGDVILGAPKSTDPQSGEMLRMFLVLRSKERGLLVKIFGSAVADPETGQLTATFDNNPRVPFEDLRVTLKGGQRGVLATPQSCGTKTSETDFTPWTEGAGGIPVLAPDAFAIDGNCSAGFSPKLVAGMSSAQSGGSGAFSFEFSRRDGEQWVDGLTAKLPQGLLAKIAGVRQCTSAEAAAAACPVESRIGSVDAGAGSGQPFFLEQKGDVYLTQGYKGGAYGLLVKVPVIAGPFRGATQLGDIVVRQALHVDRKTAEVTAISDPFPTIWHGIPLRVRQVTVTVDRQGFMRNPTDCAAKQVAASLRSAEGNTADASAPFQVSGCAGLPFKPTLALRLTGPKQVTTGKHPGVKVLVTQQPGEAGIENAVARLPKSLALDPDNAQALCEFEDGTQPDLENRCPKGSIVGRARAKTPLLNHDLAGDVYFVKNVRKDPKTGNLIRTLPMIVVALRGEIAVNLKGESSTTKDGRLVNTFASIPDAPINQFNLNIAGGKSGILAVTGTRRGNINVCASRQILEADLDGHNGRRHDSDIRVKTPCTKAQVKRAKRAAARRAKAGSRR